MMDLRKRRLATAVRLGWTTDLQLLGSSTRDTLPHAGPLIHAVTESPRRPWRQRSRRLTTTPRRQSAVDHVPAHAVSREFAPHSSRAEGAHCSEGASECRSCEATQGQLPDGRPPGRREPAAAGASAVRVRQAEDGLGDGLSAPESLDISGRMKDWAFAADSAKIATLEAVAEKVEEGQLALEGSMKVLDEIDQLLGIVQAHDEHEPQPGAAEEDIWLAQEQPRRKDAKPQRHVDSRKGPRPGKDGDYMVGLGRQPGPHLGLMIPACTWSSRKNGSHMVPCIYYNQVPSWYSSSLAPRNQRSAMMAEMRSARSRIERCSSAPSTSRLSTSEKTSTILFLLASGMSSS